MRSPHPGTSAPFPRGYYSSPPVATWKRAPAPQIPNAQRYCLPLCSPMRSKSPSPRRQNSTRPPHAAGASSSTPPSPRSSRWSHTARGLGKILTTIGDADGMIGAVDIVRMSQDRTTRDITVNARDSEHGQQVVQVVEDLPQVKVINVSDRTFLMHLGGKIEVRSKLQIRTRDDLSMVYTPGVARVCRAIASDPERAFNLTVKRNTVAVVSDGTAVLGLGDIGPRAAMPVMEGKAALFKQFANVDAFPICLDTKDTDAIVETVKNLAPAFGGINLEDISAPRCFEVEERLKDELDIPVFHDDQHGTAVVVLAALLNAAKLVGKDLEGMRVLVVGLGAAGVAVSRILLQAG